MGCGLYGSDMRQASALLLVPDRWHYGKCAQTQDGSTWQHFGIWDQLVLLGLSIGFLKWNVPNFFEISLALCQAGSLPKLDNWYSSLSHH